MHRKWWYETDRQKQRERQRKTDAEREKMFGILFSDCCLIWLHFLSSALNARKGSRSLPIRTLEKFAIRLLGLVWKRSQTKHPTRWNRQKFVQNYPCPIDGMKYWQNFIAADCCEVIIGVGWGVGVAVNMLAVTTIVWKWKWFSMIAGNGGWILRLW